MALLNLQSELARSRAKVPFSNGFEFDHWHDIWCAECVHEDYCPLLLVILHERTPDSWEDRNPGHLNRYHCREFKQRDDE